MSFLALKPARLRCLPGLDRATSLKDISSGEEARALSGPVFVWVSVCRVCALPAILLICKAGNPEYTYLIIYACVCLQALESHLQLAKRFSMLLFDSASQTFFMSPTEMT